MDGEIIETKALEPYRLTPVASIEKFDAELSRLRAFIDHQMKENVDFGHVPGIEKPFLFKAGAEHLCNLYGLAATYEILDEEKDWEEGFFRYLIKCRLQHIRTGYTVAEGFGECNSRESKYKYIWVVSDVKDEPTRTKMQAERTGKWSKQYDKKAKKKLWVFLERRANPETCSLVNTIVKMAKKRSHVDATLTATRTSGLFANDKDVVAEMKGSDVEEETGGDSGTDSDDSACPVCGAPMQLIAGPRGKFYGCTKWKETKCKGTRSYKAKAEPINDDQPPPIDEKEAAAIRAKEKAEQELIDKARAEEPRE